MKGLQGSHLPLGLIVVMLHIDGARRFRLGDECFDIVEEIL